MVNYILIESCAFMDFHSTLCFWGLRRKLLKNNSIEHINCTRCYHSTSWISNGYTWVLNKPFTMRQWTPRNIYTNVFWYGCIISSGSFSSILVAFATWTTATSLIAIVFVPVSAKYSTTICKLVDLIPALRQSDCRIPNRVNAKTVLSSSTNHGQTTARFRSFFR